VAEKNEQRGNKATHFLALSRRIVPIG